MNESALLRINGSVSVNAPFHMNGTLNLAGHLTDNYGFSSTAGQIIFSANDSQQYISGPAHTILHNMEVLQGAEVHVSSSKQLSVFGLLINHNASGGLVLNSDENGIASLLHFSSGVQGVMERYFSSDPGGYVILSSPVADQAIDPGFNQPGDMFYARYEPYEAYVSFKNKTRYPTFLDANQNSENFLSASGYYVNFSFWDDDSNSKTFEGLLHQGEVAFTLSRLAYEGSNAAGFNLMGNPYPSAIDWLAEEGWTGKEHLVGDKMGVAWIWNPLFQTFGVIHPAARSRDHNRVGHIIPATAGFFVQTAIGSHGEMLTMDDRVRVHDQAASTFRDVETEILEDFLRITVECLHYGYFDEVILEYGHQSLMMAPKLFSPNPESPQIYVCNNEEQYSMLLLPATKNDRQHTVRIQTPELGQYSLVISGSQFVSLLEITNNQTSQRMMLELEESFVIDGSDSPFLEITVGRRL